MPGALHLASDDTIRRLAARTGVVTLVRQLAGDLAQRDDEMSAFSRRAEERERELKKMLREVEVSNMDIETRLHHLSSINQDKSLGGKHARLHRNPRKPTIEREEDVFNGIEEAMEEVVGLEENFDGDYMNQQERQATIKAAGMVRRDTDKKSLDSSVDSGGKSRGTVKGWKDFLWSGSTASRKTSQASSITSDYEDEAGTIITARMASGTGTRRKSLKDDLFQPPSRKTTMENTDDLDIVPSLTRQKSNMSRKSATSISSWTLKLFAGNPAAIRDSEASSMHRGRSVTTGDETTKHPRNTSMATVQPGSSAKAALMRINSKSMGPPSRKPVPPLVLGLNGTVRGGSGVTNSLPPGSPASVDTAGNLGPVEMDTILPHDSRPPTLSHGDNDNPSEFLTDRFGFIYDQRRRKKEAEALKQVGSARHAAKLETRSPPRSTLAQDISAGSPITQRDSRPDTPLSTDEMLDERPAKRWQEYLKIATFPTELLSHTPTSLTVPTLPSPDGKTAMKRSPTFGNSGSLLSATSNPEPSASTITVDHAEMSKPFTTTSSSTQSPTQTSTATTSTTADAGVEPVKLLLAQLTELHDTLQHDKTLKWNEFLRKVRAERRKDGEQQGFLSDNHRSSKTFAVLTPEVSLIDGEMIGIATLGNKGKVGRAKYKEFYSLVLGGIPVIYRAKIWAECSGASARRVPGYYDDLVKNAEGTYVDDETISAQIGMDINRTLTDNVFFRKGPGVAKLHEVLVAYSRRNPEVGYCQGMNLIVASLLLIMPTAEDAFWVLVSLVEKILPRHYYDNSLLASRADQAVLRQYVGDLLPKLSAHLDELGIELEALTFQWFLSLFTDCLSAEALYRVWDVLLCCRDTSPAGDVGGGGLGSGFSVTNGNGGESNKRDSSSSRPAPDGDVEASEDAGGTTSPLSPSTVSTDGTIADNTLLFQVALALLKLNERSLLDCEGPGEVYAYLGGEMTNHAVGIDGLIRASEGLRGVVKRNEIEERRRREMRRWRKREESLAVKPIDNDRNGDGDGDGSIVLNNVLIDKVNGLKGNEAVSKSERASESKGASERGQHENDNDNDEDEEEEEEKELALQSPMPIQE